MGQCRRRLSWSLTSASFARIRFEIVTRLTQNRPFFDFPHMCVKPKKSNVSGLPKPRFPRRSAAYRPNSISRVLSGWEFQPKLREPLTKLHQEPLRVLLILEPDDEVVRPAHDDHISTRVPTPPPLGPQVEDVVQVNVGEQR